MSGSSGVAESRWACTLRKVSCPSFGSRQIALGAISILFLAVNLTGLSRRNRSWPVAQLRRAIFIPPAGRLVTLGRRVPLVLAKSRFNVVEADDTSIYVSCANPSRPEAVEKQIIHWYRRQAEALFPERIQSVGWLVLQSGMIHPGLEYVR